MTSSAENRKDASNDRLPPRRGRPRRKVPSLDRGGVLQFPTRSNPKDWRHRHFERKNPLNWDFASVHPALGRAMLDAVHRMSGPGKAIATGSTALAYQTQSKPFFLWLAETEKDARGQEPGKEDTILDPQIVEDFRIAMDLRATLGEVTGTTAYAYKAAPLRILRQLYLEDAAVLGPSWRDEDFLPGERIDDTKPNAPYSLAESQRIISACAAILHRTHDSGDPGDRAVMEIAAFVIIGLKLGIEPECLPVLTLANLRPDGRRIKVRYIKRRGGGGNGFRKSRTARSGPQKQSLRTAAERYEGVIAKAQGGGNGKD